MYAFWTITWDKIKHSHCYDDNARSPG